MKTLVIIALIMTSGVWAFSQKSIILKGKTESDLDYYFDDNKDSKMTVKKINGIYELLIPQKTKFEKLTINEHGNDDCDQTLVIGNLLKYCKSFKTDTIINDATHISSCLKMETMATPQYEKFVGKWRYADFELYVYTDGEFYLKYTKDNIEYQREGGSEIMDNNTLILKTIRIRNNFTETYSDNLEKIQFDFKAGALLSEKLNIELREVK